MSERAKVRPTLSELKKDLQGMTFLQKVDHLWTYYKEYLLVVFLAAVVIGVAVTGIINTSKEPLVTGMMANIEITQQGYNYLSTDYFEKLGGDPATQEVNLHYTNFESLADPTSAEDNYNAAQTLLAWVSGGMLDYAIIDKLALEFYITQEVFLDLRQFFTPQELEELAAKDMLIYGQEGEMDPEGNLIEGSNDGERIPYAVKIQSFDMVQEAMGGEEIYFTIGGNSPDLEAVRGIWEHILAWE